MSPERSMSSGLWDLTGERLQSNFISTKVGRLGFPNVSHVIWPSPPMTDNFSGKAMVLISFGVGGLAHVSYLYGMVWVMSISSLE